MSEGKSKYGKWTSEWDSSASQQQLRASGKYDESSKLAKRFNSLNEDGESRVDDEEGWRQLSFDEPPKNAAEYEAMVNKWSDAGFDVRAIDMQDGYDHSNIAVRIGNGKKESKAEEYDGPTLLSPRLAHARARIAQYEEDQISGQAAKDLYDSENNPAQGFLDRYKLRLGERLENGYYVDKDTPSNNSSKVASGQNDVSLDAAEYAKTGKDNRKDYY